MEIVWAIKRTLLHHTAGYPKRPRCLRCLWKPSDFDNSASLASRTNLMHAVFCIPPTNAASSLPGGRNPVPAVCTLRIAGFPLSGTSITLQYILYDVWYDCQHHSGIGLPVVGRPGLALIRSRAQDTRSQVGMGLDSHSLEAGTDSSKKVQLHSGSSTSGENIPQRYMEYARSIEMTSWASLAKAVQSVTTF